MFLNQDIPNKTNKLESAIIPIKIKYFVFLGKSGIDTYTCRLFGWNGQEKMSAPS